MNILNESRDLRNSQKRDQSFYLKSKRDSKINPENIPTSNTTSNNLVNLSLNAVENTLGQPLNGLLQKQIVTSNEFNILINVMIATQNETLNAIRNLTTAAGKMEDMTRHFGKDVTKISQVQDKTLETINKTVSDYNSNIRQTLLNQEENLNETLVNAIQEKIRSSEYKLSSLSEAINNNFFYGFISILIVIAILVGFSYFTIPKLNNLNNNMYTITQIQKGDLKYWFDESNHILYKKTLEELNNGK
ncbi:hypothetical protein [Veillonella criceti]|uniref:Uncharacterized protein n=1 Tax=Veillonella criceti TaxID=103891 RepID=A0A380NL34_9FIRM|nr:hypothetical protein [Veillonella criceti]SUP42830.1 Uncharacterised protein [Veillonella criceti]